MNRSKSRMTAERYISEIEEAKPILDDLWKRYAECWSEIELKMNVLRSYKRLGIINEGEMPVFERRSLRREVAAYRKKRKKTDIK